MLVVQVIESRMLRILKLTGFFACLALLGSISPVSAYNYGNNNLTYGLPFLQSSGGFLPFIGSGMLPGVSSGYLPFGLRNSLYRPYNYKPNNQTPSQQQQTSFAGNGASGVSNKPMIQQQYADPEPLGDPRQRTRAYRLEKGVHDQIAYAHKRGASTDSAPAPAPEHGRAPSSPPAAPAIGSIPSDSANFIDTVNKKFNGDISKALFDPATRSSAKSMGLIDDDGIFDADFTPARVNTIRGILNDPNLDAPSKLGAVKFLLPSKSSK